jgi:hypothetical protein
VTVFSEVCWEEMGWKWDCTWHMMHTSETMILNLDLVFQNSNTCLQQQQRLKSW